MKRPMQTIGFRGFRGFTMIEMLVAMAITVGIVLFINQIMTTVSGAVSSGTSTSRVIQNARVVIDHLDSDTAEMIGPSGGGILMITNAQTPTNTKLTPDSNVSTTFRADQIAFIRPKGSLEPICFAGDSNLSASSQAPFVKIWYGHGLRTKADGTDDGAFGSTGNIAAPTSGNQYPINWMMCRQAVFLDPDPTNLQNHADSALEGANVDSSTSTYPSNPPPKFLYSGFADAVDQTLDELNNDPTNGVLNMTVAQRLGYCYGTQRLRVNTYAPDVPLEGWRVSQMHPLIVPNVSEVIVEFAGDYMTNGGAGSTDPDGKLDVVASGNNAGQIIWYSAYNNPASTLNKFASGTTPFYDASAHGFAWTQNTGNWPWMVRIRFRVQAPKGAIVGPDGRSGYEFSRIIQINRY